MALAEHENATAARSSLRTKVSMWRRAPDVPLDTGGPTNPFDPLPNDATENTLFHLFEQIVARDPYGTALLTENDNVSRQSLMRRVGGLARKLQERLPLSSRIAILVPHSPNYAVAVLACFASGILFTPLDPRFPAKRNAKIIDDFVPTAILYSDPTDVLFLGNDHAELIKIDAVTTSSDCQKREREVGNPAFVLYTSGSTGDPKGIVLSQESIVQRVAQQVNSLHVCSLDVLVCLSSPSTVAGLREMLSALVAGAAVCMADPEKLGLRHVRQLIGQLNVSLVYAVPALAREIFSSREPGFASLRVVRLGGEIIKGSDIALLRFNLPNDTHIQIGYSSTEAPGAQRFVPKSEAIDLYGAPHVGTILPGTEYAVLDDDGMPLPDGEDGELVLRGPYVSLGLWRDGRLREEPPFEGCGKGHRVVRTGDIVRVKDGMIAILGRKDRQIKVNGRRVDPAEIEAIIRSVGAVDDAVVLPKNGAGSTIIGFVASAKVNDRDVLEQAVRGRLKDKLPVAWHPHRFYVLPSLPRLPSGKIHAVMLLALDDAEPTEPQEIGIDSAAASEGADLVRTAWRRVLGRHARAASASFQECGGDSLSLLRAVFEIEEALQCVVQLDRLRLDMTVEEMAFAILHSCEKEQRALSRVIVLPGLLGDSPALASLRSDLSSLYQFQVFAYPDWVAMVANSYTVEDIADELARELLASGEPNFRLLGLLLRKCYCIRDCLTSH